MKKQSLRTSRLWLAFLLLLSIIPAAATAVSLVYALNPDRNATPTPQVMGPFQVENSPDHEVEVIYDVSRIDIAQQQLYVTAILTIGEPYFAGLHNLGTDAPLYTNDRLNPGYSGQMYSLQITPYSGVEELPASTPIEVPFSLPENASLGLVSIKDISLPLTGDSSQYPNDSYTAFNALVLNEPNAFTPLGEAGLPDMTPVHSALAGFSVQEHEDPIERSLFSPVPPTRPVLITVQRDLVDIVPIYSSALTPIMIVLAIHALLAVVAITHPTLSRDSALNLSLATTVGLAALLLTILPLRTVLVPTNIESLTRIDRILGLQTTVTMALIVWNCFKATRFVGNKPESEN